MFDTKARDVAFNTITKVISYWIMETNHGCAASFINLAEQLPLTNEEKRKLSQVTRAYDSFFLGVSSYANEKKNPDAVIPPNYKLDTESAFAYVLITAALNFLDSDMFGEAYNLIISSTDNWKELYVKLIAAINGHPHKDDFCRWCVTHSVVALDVEKTKMLDYGVIMVLYDENEFQGSETIEFEAQ